MGIKISLVEKAFLGALIFNGQYNPALFQVAVTRIEEARTKGITPISTLKNQIVYKAMVDLMVGFGGFDMTLLLDTLAKNDKLSDLGGEHYLYELTHACADPINWQKYCHALLEVAERRETEAIGQWLTEQANNPNLDGVLGTAQTRLGRVMVAREGSPVKPMSDIVVANRQRKDERRENPTPIPGYRTGISRLDLKLGGLQKGWLIGIMGNSNMGKSTAAVSFTLGMTRSAVHLGFIAGGVVLPTEMSASAWTDKLAAAIAGVTSDQIVEGRLDERENDRVDQAYDWLEAQCIDVLDFPDPEISYIQSIVKVGVETGRYGWACVDSYSNVTATGMSDIYSIGAAVAHGLHVMAIENNIPVLTTIQAKPEVLARSNKIPRLNDAYGGAVISQRCDVMISIYNHDHHVRESGYDPTLSADQQKPGVVLPNPALPPGVGLFQVTKNRHKEGVNVAVRSALVCGSRFENLAEDEIFTGATE